MDNEENEKDKGFFQIPQPFFDYGLQVFTHIEYDIISYILRNTIGWQKLEFDASIKKIALHRHYSEKNIIIAINNLIEKTGVFSKIVYREKGNCIKKTKYLVSENSIKILNDYVMKNIPDDYEEKKDKIKNRSLEAENRLNEGKEKFLQKQQELLKSIKNENKDITEIENTNEIETTDNDKPNYLSAWQEIINDYNPDNGRIAVYGNTEKELSIFKNWKEYNYDCHLGYIPQETYDKKIDIKLSDLIPLIDNIKTIDFLKTLIKYKGMKGGQLKLFYDRLKIDFGIFNENNYDRINVIFE
jgi:hypothetical protein